MQRTTLTISGHKFHLDPGVDLDTLTHTAAEAVRGGGGILDFTAAGERSVKAIVSPGVPIILETTNFEVDETNSGHASFEFGIDLSDDER